ncbi:hypothetical protein MLD38_014753 [Melastoma candidum]|uniref:Uncharacterized protein n=1 Tax=Melastoma candidum TaxID=119954 RepID=A0ACB9RDW7_9MYRT|nr:hypothetical protein MLD38_014753 [Melastoma candidum]
MRTWRDPNFSRRETRGRKQEHRQRRLPSPPQLQRRLWVKDRPRDWWERCNSPEFPANEFRAAFCMSKPTFYFICYVLDRVIMKKKTALREVVPTRHSVAVCIWQLATGEPLRSVVDRFGLGISTCHKLIVEVCSEMKTLLMRRYLRWPDHISAFEIKPGFERIPGIRGMIGTIEVGTGETKGSWIVGGPGHPLADGSSCRTQTKRTSPGAALVRRVEAEVEKVAKVAFQRLKWRWGCLRKRTEVQVTSCGLAVFCIMSVS